MVQKSDELLVTKASLSFLPVPLPPVGPVAPSSFLPQPDDPSKRTSAVSALAPRSHAPVAQISNLLYRRASSLRASGIRQALKQYARLPIGNRRYSRLEICATF